MASGGISSRVFGEDIDPSVKRTLQARQDLAERTREPNDSIIFDHKVPNTESDKGAHGEHIGPQNFEGVAELSSRTPFARMWTAVEVIQAEKAKNAPEAATEEEVAEWIKKRTPPDSNSIGPQLEYIHSPPGIRYYPKKNSNAYEVWQSEKVYGPHIYQVNTHKH